MVPFFCKHAKRKGAAVSKLYPINQRDVPPAIAGGNLQNDPI
jgi:hypothetical protein